MRPQGFGQVAGHSLEDLGWNDMGFEPPKPSEAPRDADHDAFGDEVVEHPRAHPTGLTPIGSPVHDQQAEIADRLGTDETDDEEFDETAEPYETESGEITVPAPPAVEPVLDAFETDEAEIERISVPMPPTPQPVPV